MHSRDELRRLYGRRFAGREEYRAGVWRALIDRFFVRWLEPGASVLDLGCGHCEFINAVRARERVGLDLNPEAVAQAAPGVRILAQAASEPWALEGESLDVVFASNFFEHLPTKRDLRATLVQAWRCLRPGGRLIAMGPNLRHLPGEYWDFFDHHLPLTERSLGEALMDAGFSMERVVPRFLPYTMSQGARPPLWLVSLYLRLTFLWPLFGRQFLVIARK